MPFAFLQNIIQLLYCADWDFINNDSKPINTEVAISPDVEERWVKASWYKLIQYTIIGKMLKGSAFVFCINSNISTEIFKEFCQK